MCCPGVAAGPPVADAAAVAPKLSLETLRARYRLPISHFAVIDGVPVHYTDEGKGPVVILLHASYLDLTSWNDWARDLARDHRVLRLDRLRFGLTGTYPGNIVDYDHEVRLLEAFAAQRKVTRFALVGASSGGMVAAIYARRHPEQISNLILMNFPIGHGRIAKVPAMPAAPGGAGQMRMILEGNMVDKTIITPAFVDRLGDFADREDQGGTAAASFDKAAELTEADRAAILRQIHSRTMVVWSAENRTLPVSAGQAAFDAIGATDKYLTIVEAAGHMLPLERGPVSASLARRFLEGQAPPAVIAP